MPPQDPRRPTPLGTRLIERRTRSRASHGPGELVPLLLLRDGLLGAGQGLARLARWFNLASRPPLTALPEASAAERSGPVKLRGVIETVVPGFETPGSPTPVVFARTLYLNQPRAGQARSLSDELRGVDFAVKLPSGERVEIGAAEVRLTARPTRVLRPNLAELGRRGGDGQAALLPGLAPFVREAHLREGDTIEVLGVLVRQVNPGGEGAFGRGTPLVTRLVPPSGDKWLWIRRAP